MCTEKRDEPKAVILHDSLCKGINETILSKEKVNTKKIWAPTLEEMSKQIDMLEENVDVIIIQALTRDLNKFNIPEFGAQLNLVIENAVSKSKKVVIPTIIAREDDERLHMMAEVVNANIKYDNMNSADVFICDNENLRDRKFRNADGLHLTTHGTSVLANNIKYKIAEALNIHVERKQRKPLVNLYGNNYNNGYLNTSNSRWNGRNGNWYDE